MPELTFLPQNPVCQTVNKTVRIIKTLKNLDFKAIGCLLYFI